MGRNSKKLPSKFFKGCILAEGTSTYPASHGTGPEGLHRASWKISPRNESYVPPFSEQHLLRNLGMSLCASRIFSCVQMLLAMVGDLPRVFRPQNRGGLKFPALAIFDPQAFEELQHHYLDARNTKIQDQTHRA